MGHPFCLLVGADAPPPYSHAWPPPPGRPPPPYRPRVRLRLLQGALAVPDGPALPEGLAALLRPGPSPVVAAAIPPSGGSGRKRWDLPPKPGPPLPLPSRPSLIPTPRGQHCRSLSRQLRFQPTTTPSGHRTRVGAR